MASYANAARAVNTVFLALNCRILLDPKEDLSR
jgi:hypothetical protein